MKLNPLAIWTGPPSRMTILWILENTHVDEPALHCRRALASNTGAEQFSPTYRENIMTPQLSVQQLEHAIKNLQRRVDAKKLEVHSYKQFSDSLPSAVAQLLGMKDPSEDEEPAASMSEVMRRFRLLQEATENFFTAKLNQALIDLEELELTLKAYKQMSSPIQVPGMQIKR